MKIIQDNYTKNYQCVCGGCTSIYQFTQDEALKTAKKEITISCPLCGYVTQLAPNKEERFQNVTEVKEEKKVSKPKAKKVLLEDKNDKPKTTRTSKAKATTVEEPKESTTEVLPETQTA